MMRRRASFLWLIAGLACACNALPLGNPSPAPTNVCGQVGATCQGYSPDAGVVCQSTDTAPACQVNSIGPYVLLVSVPAAAVDSFPEGATYAVTGDQLYATASAVNSANSCDQPLPNLCFRLGAIQAAYGAYVVTPQSTGSTTLPVSVTFWPLWTPPDTQTSAGVPTDARLLNLPLPSVFATVGAEAVPKFPFDPLLVQATSIEWAAPLPPSVSTPEYTAVVAVSPPLDDTYPGFSYTLAIPFATNNIAEEFGPGATFSKLPPLSSNAKLTVQRADGQPFEGGWTAYYRDPDTLLTLTSKVTLTGAPAVVQLEEISTNPVDISTAQFVIEPPPGIVMPQLVDIDVATEETYAAIPPIAHVSGQVESAAGHGVAATLLFFSAGLDDVASCEQMPGVPPTPTLVYETTIATAGELASSTGGQGEGTFSVELPQGRYGVVVQPTAASGYAKSTYEYLYVATPAHPACAGASPTIDGVVLKASDPVTVTGSAKTADGRPLANATVVFAPAAALAPGRFQPPTAARSGSTPEDLWPRPFTTTTGAEGAFTVNLDPYAQYDVTVRPQGGSNFPWVVRPNLFVFPGMLAIDPIVVAAPSLLDLTLQSPVSTVNAPVPLVGAVVEAYAFYNGCIPPAECPVAVAIGDGLTDANGHLTMMLTTQLVGN